MALPDVGSRVKIVQVENPDLEEFIGYHGSILKFMGDSLLIRLDGLTYPMEFTVRDVILL